MKLVEKMKKALKLFLKEERKQSTPYNGEIVRSIFAQMSETNDPTRRIKELEALIFQLSGKINNLVDKVVNLDSQITYLTTIHEELMHIIDQQIYEFEQQEDNLSGVELNSKEKKYELN